MKQRLASMPLLLLLFLYASFMIATNHRLTILDDEATIITAANAPVIPTLESFFSGYGQHEHPPLSDFFLHGWLILTQRSFAFLRIFATFFYIAGLLVLARCGEMLGSLRTAWAVLLLGMLWPFGYFYARITGWYCFCFCIVALVTYTYLRLIQHPTLRSWTAFISTGVLLLWSNYYGVAVLLLLLSDMLIRRRKHLRALAPGILSASTLFILSFLPLLRALLFDAQVTVSSPSSTAGVNILKAGYILFALLASVAVAPWFFWWSVPIAIAAALLFTLLMVHGPSRSFCVYFLFLIAGLGATNHLDLKRLLFLTPWLMLAIALLITTAGRRSAITALSAVALIFFIGWIGITTGRHPATVNFYEPWGKVVASTLPPTRSSGPILSDSGLYFFYLNYRLGLEDRPSRSTYLGEAAYRSKGASIYQLSLPNNSQPSGNLTVVEGVDTIDKLQIMSRTMDHVLQACQLSSLEHSTPDPAAQFKHLLGPFVPVLPWRITISRFNCGIGS